MNLKSLKLQFQVLSSRMSELILFKCGRDATNFVR